MRWILGSILFLSVLSGSLVFLWRRDSVTIQTTAPIATGTITKTNSWFSSAYSFPSEPLFALPGAYRITTQGLEIGMPKVTVSEKLIAAPFLSRCTLNRTTPVTKATVVSYSDWTVTIRLTDTTGTFDVTLTQGSPVVSFASPEDLFLHCPGTNTVQREHDVVLSSGDISLLVLSETPVQVQSDRVRINPQSRLILLPQLSEELITTIRRIRPAAITATGVTHTTTETINTTYTFATNNQHPTLFTLWPHHRLHSVMGIDTPLASYDTVRGSMQLYAGTRFTTQVPLPLLPFTFASKDTQTLAPILIQDTKLFVTGKNPAPSGIYFRGTWIGSLTSAAQLADLSNLPAERERLLNLLETTLTETATTLRYDQDKKMFVALNPEFGNEHGNDHHFHYGYYIRAAAVLGSYRPLPESVTTMINEMVDDIATMDASSTRYPRLRSYSIYEGHSWADGRALFADGNNQESTSEALNAWYALSLWGTVTKNQELVNRGTWLFSQELTGTQSYWYGIKNPFPSTYGRQLASIVWGGKREFATWFSSDPMHIYGIQWLPLTPASSYLSSTVTAAHLDELQQLSRTPEQHEWGDLFVSVLSFQQPQVGRTRSPAVRSYAGTKLQSLFWYYQL